MYFIYYLHKYLWSNIPQKTTKSKKQTSPFINLNTTKNTTRVDILSQPLSPAHDVEKDPIYVAGTFSFMMEASPDQAGYLHQNLGGGWCLDVLSQLFFWVKQDINENHLQRW